MSESNEVIDYEAIAASVIESNRGLKANLAQWGDNFEKWGEWIEGRPDSEVAAAVKMADSIDSLLRQAAIFAAVSRRFSAALRAEAERRGL